MEIREESEGLDVESSIDRLEQPEKINHVEKPRVDRRKILSEKKLESLRKARESKANKRRAKKKEKEDHEREIQQKLKKLEQMELREKEGNVERNSKPLAHPNDHPDQPDERQMSYEEPPQPLHMDEIELVNDEPQIEVQPVKRTRTRGQTRQVENTLNMVGFADPHLADEKLKEQEEFLKYQTQEMEDLRDAYEEMIQQEYDRKKKERQLKEERERAVRRVRSENRRRAEAGNEREDFDMYRRQEVNQRAPPMPRYDNYNSGVSSIFY